MIRKRHAIGTGIVLFWLAMTATLLQREVLVPGALPDATPSLREPTDVWMGIYAPGEGGSEKRIGHVHTTSGPESRGGADGMGYGLEFKLATTMLSIPTELTIDGTAWVADGRGLAEFDFDVSSFDEHALKASGVVEDGRLRLAVETAGERFPLEFPVGDDLLVQGNFGAATLNLPALEIGEEIWIDAFDPLTLSKGKARVACIGMETVEYDGESVMTKILMTSLSGIETKTWVTLDEEVMRVETPYGFVLKRLTPQEALREADPEGAAELIQQVAVRPTGKRPFRGARRMQFRVGGDPRDNALPEGAHQRRLGPVEYVVEVPILSTDGAEAGDATDREVYLRGDPFVQVGHERIASQVEAIVLDEQDPWEKAQRIYEWVYENVEKAPVLSFPSALDVLANPRGDCNEHTVLFAALSRTAGIPTQIAVGVVWSDELEGFFYHAWPEVYIGQWVAMDPTLGQPIADATHIKLLQGSVADWPKLAPYLGKLRLDILEVE